MYTATIRAKLRNTERGLNYPLLVTTDLPTYYRNECIVLFFS